MISISFRVNNNAKKSKTVNSFSKKHRHNYCNKQNDDCAKFVLSVSSDTFCDTLNGLNEQHLNHPKYVILRHLNINSLRNKFSSFKDLVLNETDVCLLSETKIDGSFPNSQIFAEGYRMFRKYSNKNGGGLILHVNKGIPGKLINLFDFKEGSGIIVFKFSTSNKKWLLLGNYEPPSQNELSHINEIKLVLDFFSCSYKNFLLLGDLNLSTENPNFKILLNSFDLKSLTKIPTCYKSLLYLH